MKSFVDDCIGPHSHTPEVVLGASWLNKVSEHSMLVSGEACLMRWPSSAKIDEDWSLWQRGIVAQPSSPRETTLVDGA